jgi:CheY-like chemotaxis protein
VKEDQAKIEEDRPSQDRDARADCPMEAGYGEARHFIRLEADAILFIKSATGHYCLGNFCALCDLFRLARIAGGVLLSVELPIILVVEDEAAIQIVIEETLTDGGFEPAIAASGEEAVTLLKGRAANYCALVTDISLRGKMDGWEVARQAREIEPEFPIVYVSGASAADWASMGVPNSIMLEKPFAPAQLITAIANLLNSGTQKL